MFTRLVKSRRQLFIQPRMGFGNIDVMADCLDRLKDLEIPVVGTITLDTYTRQNKKVNILETQLKGLDLNGFPLISYPVDAIVAKLASIQDSFFPIQIRHGSPLPYHIFESMVKCGFDYTEGGPISYCLPYSRVPLTQTIEAWQSSCQLLSQSSSNGHIESFAGCMLGQLCPPSILIALNILEGLFFVQNGIQDISFSYAQYYNIYQDVAATRALKKLARQFFPDISWHLVIYTFMGLFPQTDQGWETILRDSIKLSVLAEAERLIVKTRTEAFKIPTFEDNLEAITKAHAYSTDFKKQNPVDFSHDHCEEEIIYQEALNIIESVLNLHPQLSKAMEISFKKGYLDIPFCLHPDNLRQSVTSIDGRGYLTWLHPGKIPIKFYQPSTEKTVLSSDSLLMIMNYNRRKYDQIIAS